MHLLTSHQFVTFYLHDIGCRALEATWQNNAGSELFREAILAGLGLARQHRVEGWIADDRRLGPMQAEDLYWIATDVLPALAQAGVRRLAMLESEDLLNQELIQEAYTPPLTTLPIELRRFTDLQAARVWTCRSSLQAS